MTEKNAHKFIVFDFDQTLFNETLCPDVEEILKLLKTNGYYLSIASFNRCVDWFCDRYSIKEYFDIICGEMHDTKINHFKKITDFYKQKCLMYDNAEILFFDDCIDNFYNIKNDFNVKYYKVNEETGITLSDVQWLL
jgi:magnesium-dependent phosphatase-1